MTLSRAEWDAECIAMIGAYLKAGNETGAAIRKANERMTRVFGPRPAAPKQEPGAPWWMRFGLEIVAGGQMDKVMKFVNRYFVLFSVIYTALSAGLTLAADKGVAWAPVAKTVVGTLFGLLSFTPDPAAASAALGFSTAAVALYGAGLKLYRIFRPVPAPIAQ